MTIAFFPRVLPFLLLPFLAISCRHNPHKAEVVETQIEKTDQVADGGKIGVDKDGDMVYQKKTLLAEELRKLENEVNELEDRVYGTRKYGTLGLYGKYSSCLRKIPPTEKGSLPPLGKLDRWSEKPENSRLGFDANGTRLSSVTEEKLKTRLDKLQEYRKTLQEREDQFNENIRACEALAMKGAVPSAD